MFVFIFIPHKTVSQSTNRTFYGCPYVMEPYKCCIIQLLMLIIISAVNNTGNNPNRRNPNDTYRFTPLRPPPYNSTSGSSDSRTQRVRPFSISTYTHCNVCYVINNSLSVWQSTCVCVHSDKFYMCNCNTILLISTATENSMSKNKMQAMHFCFYFLLYYFTSYVSALILGRCLITLDFKPAVYQIKTINTISYLCFYETNFNFYTHINLNKYIYSFSGNALIALRIVSYHFNHQWLHFNNIFSLSYLKLCILLTRCRFRLDDGAVPILASADSFLTAAGFWQ